MRVYKRNGKWQVEFTQDGKRQRLSVNLPGDATKEDAERAASIRMRQSFTVARQAGDLGSANGRVAGTASSSTWSLSEALERCYQVRWAGQKGEANVRHRVVLLQAQVGFWMLNDISYRKLLDLQQGWAKEFKPATVNRRMSLLKTAIKHARREDPSVPTIEFPEFLAENNVKERYLTLAEEAGVLAFLDARIAIEEAQVKAGVVLSHQGDVGDTWKQAKDAFIILVDTGLRRSELLGLTAGDYDGTRVTLKHGRTKNGKGRQVPLVPRAREAVERWVGYTKRSANWLDGKWDAVRVGCQLKDVNLHILRHTCASRLIQKGVSIFVVSKWLGHSSLKITERYAHLAPDMFEDALARLGTPSGGG